MAIFDGVFAVLVLLGGLGLWLPRQDLQYIAAGGSERSGGSVAGAEGREPRKSVNEPGSPSRPVRRSSVRRTVGGLDADAFGLDLTSRSAPHCLGRHAEVVCCPRRMFIEEALPLLGSWPTEVVSDYQEFADRMRAPDRSVRAESRERLCSKADLCSRVRVMLQGLAGDEQRAAETVEMLLRLRDPAIPCLIRQLPQLRKPVRFGQLRLKSQGWELFVHYTPQEQVDVADYVLTALTGVSFGPLINGATDAQRSRVIQAWSRYLATLCPTPAKPSP